MHTIEAKNILTAYGGGMNLYRGCTHGCIYCDVRSRVYGFRHAMEDVEVKLNAPALLNDALRRKRQRGVITTGAMGDPYQPCEEQLGLMRQCLEVVLRRGFGVSPHTKSVRLLHDIDLLEAINRRAKCVVQTTLTTVDDALSRLIEPAVNTTTERIAMLRRLQERGIPTVVWICPVLPYLTDSEENLAALLDACEATVVRGIICYNMGVTLREGDREHFYAMLDRHFPGLRSRYEREYGSSYWCLSPHHERLSRLLHERCAAAGILHTPADVTAYIHTLPPPPSLFD